MITLLKIFVTLVILGGSSYGYFSSHKQKAVENGETQNTQQKATSENIETIPNEPSDKDITAPVQEAEKEKIDEPIVSAVTTPKAPDEKEKKKEEEKQKHLIVDAQELAKKVNEYSITISRQVGEGEKMFGAVTSSDIAEALEKEGINIDKRQVYIEKPIKDLGLFQVPIKIHQDITSLLKVWIVKA